MIAEILSLSHERHDFCITLRVQFRAGFTDRPPSIGSLAISTISNMLDKRFSPSIYPKLVVALINAYLVAKATTPPELERETVEPTIARPSSGIRFWFEKLIDKCTNGGGSGGLTLQWTLVLLCMQGPFSLPFFYYLWRERKSAGPRVYARFTDLDIVSTAFLLAGSMIRLWSFKALGEFFTFNVSVKDNHQLIKTGPHKVL